MADYIGGGRKTYFIPGVESDRQREALEQLDLRLQAEVRILQERASSLQGRLDSEDEVDVFLFARVFS